MPTRSHPPSTSVRVPSRLSCASDTWPTSSGPAACSRTCPVVPSRRRRSELRCARSANNCPCTRRVSTQPAQTSVRDMAKARRTCATARASCARRSSRPRRPVPRLPHSSSTITTGRVRRRSTLVVVVSVGGAMLGLLLLVQVYVRRRSNRILNIGLLGATVIVVAILGWTLVRFSAAHDALEPRPGARVRLGRGAVVGADPHTARPEQREPGSDRARLGRRLPGRVRSGHARPRRQRRHRRAARRRARRSRTRNGEGDRIAPLAGEFRQLRDVHDQVRRLDDDGHYNEAVGLSVGTNDNGGRARPRGHGRPEPGAQGCRRPREHAPDEHQRAQVRLLGAASDARSGYGVLEIAIPVLAILAGLLVLLGLERRIGEYR